MITSTAKKEDLKLFRENKLNIRDLLFVN